MRIAFITPEFVSEPFFDGGLANYLHRICLGLTEIGHKPVVIVGANKDEVIEHEGIEVHRVKVRTRWLRWAQRVSQRRLTPAVRWVWQSWKLNQKLRQLHQEQRFDIAQFASYTSTALFCPPSIPSVVRVSSLRSVWDEAYGIPKTITRAIIHYLEVKSFKRADRLIGPSWVMGQAVERATDKKVTLVESPYVQKKEVLDEQPYKDLLGGKQYLLFFGTVGLLKGVRTIGDIILRLLETHPDLFFVFAGKDLGYQGKPMMDYVLNRAGSHRARVFYLGRMPHCQLYPIIEHSQAVILPSRIDNFPNTCLEAMALGSIVVGTKGASFEQLIENGKSGFLCEIDNEQSLLEAVERALALSDDDKQRISNRAKERIDVLRPGFVVNRLLEFYKEVIQENSERLRAQTVQDISIDKQPSPMLLSSAADSSAADKKALSEETAQKQATESVMGTKVTLSIVIACYNCAEWVSQTLESVLAQMRDDWEVIVVDDGSADKSSEIVREYVAQDGRIRLIQQANAGMPAARNKGAKTARGTFICFLDADDLWDRRFIETMVVALEAEPRITGCVCESLLFYENGQERLAPLPVKEKRLIEIDDILTNCGWGVNAAVLRREAFERVGRFDEKFKSSADWDLWLRMLAAGSFLVIRQPLALYRQHSMQTSKNRLRMAHYFKQVTDKFQREHSAVVQRYGRKRYREGIARTLRRHGLAAERAGDLRSALRITLYAWMMAPRKLGHARAAATLYLRIVAGCLVPKPLKRGRER